MGIEVIDNPDLTRYEVRVDGELAGFVQYRVQGNVMTMVHAEVDPSFEGKGVGSELAKQSLSDVRARSLELIPRCPFIAHYVRHHPGDYLDLVPESLRDQVTAGN